MGIRCPEQGCTAVHGRPRPDANMHGEGDRSHKIYAASDKATRAGILWRVNGHSLGLHCVEETVASQTRRPLPDATLGLKVCASPRFGRSQCPLICIRLGCTRGLLQQGWPHCFPPPSAARPPQSLAFLPTWAVTSSQNFQPSPSPSQRPCTSLRSMNSRVLIVAPDRALHKLQGIIRRHDYLS